MAEYIDRLKVLKKMHGSHTLPFFIGHRTDEDIMFCQMLDIVKEQPTADLVEVVHGKWVKPTMINGRTFDFPHCSVCGDVPCDTKSYCPNCGAKMDGDVDEGKIET